jgi:hypothetical protein
MGSRLDRESCASPAITTQFSCPTHAARSTCGVISKPWTFVKVVRRLVPWRSWNSLNVGVGEQLGALLIMLIIIDRILREGPCIAAVLCNL